MKSLILALMATMLVSAPAETHKYDTIYHTEETEEEDEEETEEDPKLSSADYMSGDILFITEITGNVEVGYCIIRSNGKVVALNEDEYEKYIEKNENKLNDDNVAYGKSDDIPYYITQQAMKFYPSKEEAILAIAIQVEQLSDVPDAPEWEVFTFDDVKHYTYCFKGAYYELSEEMYTLWTMDNTSWVQTSGGGGGRTYSEGKLTLDLNPSDLLDGVQFLVKIRVKQTGEDLACLVNLPYHTQMMLDEGTYTISEISIFGNRDLQLLYDEVEFHMDAGGSLIVPIDITTPQETVELATITDNEIAEANAEDAALAEAMQTGNGDYFEELPAAQEDATKKKFPWSLIFVFAVIAGGVGFMIWRRTQGE